MKTLDPAAKVGFLHKDTKGLYGRTKPKTTDVGGTNDRR